jgi:transcriptional regulator with XRE-family HTH domain
MTKAPNPIDRHVGARVRMRRLMVGLSQSKLAESLSVTFQQVQKYEKGANRIGASRLQQLARVLDVPPSFFFEGAPTVAPSGVGFNEDPGNAYVVNFLSTAEGLQLNRAFSAIKDPKLRKTVIDLVERIAYSTEPAPAPTPTPETVETSR